MCMYRSRRPGLSNNTSPGAAKTDRFRVLFSRSNGKPLDVWYTFSDRKEAEAFVQQVRASDSHIRFQIVDLQPPQPEREEMPKKPNVPL